jgi:serine/threonine protein kinase
MQASELFDIHSDAKATCLGPRFKSKLLDFLSSPGVAVKIIKVHYEVAKRSGLACFLEETSRIRLVRRTLGADAFARFSCVRSVTKGGPFAFVIKSRDPSALSFRLCLGEKTFVTSQLYMILQEQGQADLRTLLRADPACIDVGQLDRDVSGFFRLLHEGGVVHKDLKPANIVFFPDSLIKYKVIDYGLCSCLDDWVGSWKAKGTPGYMSPVFLLCNGQTMDTVHEHYVNKRVHRQLYGLALEKFKYANGPPLYKNLVTDPKLYKMILQKNDEFAFAIILIELQGCSKKSLCIKRKLAGLLGYEQAYFRS